MWISQDKYERMVKAEAVGEASQDIIKHYHATNIASNKEIRRLTNVIINLKAKGHNLSPESSDEHWGRYSTVELEAEEAARGVPQPTSHSDTGFSSEAAAVAEVEFLAELDGELEKEDALPV